MSASTLFVKVTVTVAWTYTAASCRNPDADRHPQENYFVDAQVLKGSLCGAC